MIKPPKVCFNKQNQIYVTFYLQGKRYRLFNGSKFSIKIYPNSYPVKNRYAMGQLLAGEIYKKLMFGQGPSLNEGQLSSNESDLFYLKSALDKKLNESYSKHHKRALIYTFNKLTKDLKGQEIPKKHIESVLGTLSNNTSFNTLRRNMKVLFGTAIDLGLKENPMNGVKTKRAKARLHKSYQNIPEILEEIKSFDFNLHLCCLFTYGCLLRPHREIRELKWGDFSSDLKHIHLSGSRNKSGRNRIVPVPEFIRILLEPGQKDDNIFSGTAQPYNADYFKTVWGRFKKTTKLLEDGQTLYSFRHSGAIDIFQRTGSIVKLKQAMGHSSINVSLTYLRGLKVAELTEEDMPLLG